MDETNAQGGIAGRKVQLLVEDDQYDTTKSISAYHKLVSEGAVAIISSTYGSVFATADLAVKDNVIVIDPLDCNNEIAKLAENTFCIATESESIGRSISQDISQKGFEQVGVIYDEKNPFMVLVQSVIQKEHPNSVIVGLDQGNADFKATLTRLKAKDIRALVLLGHDPMGEAMREARNLGIKAQFYTVGTITSPGYQKLAGDSANGTLVAYWEAVHSSAYQSFLDKFQKKVGRPPILELATIPTYDSTKILMDALRVAVAGGKPIDIAAAKRYFYTLKDYPGLSGTITMDPDGAVRTIREAIYAYKSGKLVAAHH